MRFLALLKILLLVSIMSFPSLGKTSTLKEYVKRNCVNDCVDYDTLIQTVTFVSESTNIDPILILSIMRTESNFRPKANSTGNVGLMQVNLRYHKKKFETNSIYNPVANIIVGSGILKDCLIKHKNVKDKALRCYNGGGDNRYTFKVNKHYSDISKLVF